jgi:hypothetical protein
MASTRTVTATLFPALSYKDAPHAVRWLQDAFGFEEKAVLHRPWLLRRLIALMRPGAACPSGRVGTGLGSDVRGARSASFRCRSA